jgi:hypothetical protein
MADWGKSQLEYCRMRGMPTEKMPKGRNTDCEKLTGEICRLGGIPMGKEYRLGRMPIGRK